MNSTFTPVGPGQIDGPDFAGRGGPTTEIGVRRARSVFVRVFA